MSRLFDPLYLGKIVLRNRIAVSPMCMYSAINGLPNDWHLVHLGSRATGGAGLILTEATAVEPEGRITPGCTGIWSDDHIEPWAKIVRFCKQQGACVGIQLAHAGRKASSPSPFDLDLSRPVFTPWQVVGPSPIPFTDKQQTPHELTPAEIDQLVHRFVQAAQRAFIAGFDVIEIHAAHGYLLHSFYSPLSNHRTDDFGGSFENRTRFLLRVTTETRRAIPNDMPVFVRLSCSDWHENGWTIEDSVRLSKLLKAAGADLIDCSSGGAVPNVHIPSNAGYQVPFARQIRSEAGIMTAAVGAITTAQQVDEIVQNDDADVILLGRASLREPNFPLHAARELDIPFGLTRPPVQYERGW